VGPKALDGTSGWKVMLLKGIFTSSNLCAIEVL
jgi:hypothetical protein